MAAFVLCVNGLGVRMNDFTKEELICLRDNIVVPETTPEKGIILNAYRKIVELIDNYCEHENSGEGYNCTECRDCGAMW